MRRDVYLLLISLLMFSCERQELTYDYAPFCDVSLTMNWQHMAERPLGMSVLFYPQNGDAVVQLQTNEVSSANLELRQGKYDVVVFNQIPSDFGTIDFIGLDKFETIGVHARSTSSKWYASKGDNEVIAREPEPLAVAVIKAFEVTEDMVEASMEAKANSTKGPTKAELTVVPLPVISSTLIRVKIKGIHNVRSIRGSLSGMAAGYSFASAQTSSEVVTHLLEEWQVKTDEGSYTEGEAYTQFSTFGLPPQDRVVTNITETDVEQYLNLEILLKDNKTIVKVRKKIDRMIRIELPSDDPDNPSVIREEIVIDIGLPPNPDKPNPDPDPEDTPVVLPDVKPEGGSEGGFDADVSDWGDEEIVEIPM